MLNNTIKVVNGWGKQLNSPKFIEVRYEDEPTDIEVAVFCSHDRGTHKEEVFSDWSDMAKIIKVDICDHCNEEVMPDERAY